MGSKIIIIIGLFALLAGCGKESPAIGGGEPEKEFQSCLKLSQKGDFEESVQCLEMFKARYPQTGLGQEAELRIGDAYFEKKDYLLAAESYIAFIRLHPRHSKVPYAHYKAGLSYYKESPKAIDRDQSYLDDAMEHLRIVVRRYPRSDSATPAKLILHDARKRIAERNFYIGNFYYRTGEYLACVPRFWTVVRKYPDSGLAPKALYKLVEANIQLGQLENAKQAFGTLSTSFPDSKYTKRAEKKLLRAAKEKSK